MSKSVVLVTAERLRLGELAIRYSEVGRPNLTLDERLVVETTDGFFAIEPSEELRAHYESEELAKITLTIKQPNFSLLEYRTNADLRRALGPLSVISGVLVDDDHGRIRPLAELQTEFSEQRNELDR